METASQYQKSPQSQNTLVIDHVPTSGDYGLIMAPPLVVQWKAGSADEAIVTMPDGTTTTFGKNQPDASFDFVNPGEQEDQLRKIIWKDLEAAYFGDNKNARAFYDEHMGEAGGIVFHKNDLVKIAGRLYEGFISDFFSTPSAKKGELLSLQAYQAICKERFKKLTFLGMTGDEITLECTETGESFVLTQDIRHGKTGLRVTRYLPSHPPETILGEHGEEIKVTDWDEYYLFYTNFEGFDLDFQHGNYSIGRNAF